MMQINKFQETKLILITRKDLHTEGYTVPQAAHSLADFAYIYPETFKKWKEESNSIICLSAKSQEHLLNLYHKFSSRTEGVLFYEPDVDEHTSVCLYGTPEVRKGLSHLPLSLKKPTDPPLPKQLDST